MIKNLIQSIFKKYDLQLIRYSKTDEFRIINLLEKHNIDTIIDCGANNGLYGKNLRELGFEGRIISFEPIKSLYLELEKNAKYDDLWSVNNYGLGDYDGTAKINISQNMSSSSLLNIIPSHVNSEPKSKIIKTEEVIIKKLSTVFDKFNLNQKLIYLKLDVQGYEDKVLDGAEDVIKIIKGIQIEMSLIPLYYKSILLPEMINRLNNYEFKLMGILPVFWDQKTKNFSDFMIRIY
tara:strand:+ start:31 stop:735 length:705 start_codon:yes stop_codon:yes gene_type:complete